MNDIETVVKKLHKEVGDRDKKISDTVVAVTKEFLKKYEPVNNDEE